MTEKEKNEKWLMEIKARRDVIAKIKNPLERLRKQAEKNLQARKNKVAAAREYASIEEAREIWGYNGITEKEFDEIKKVFIVRYIALNMNFFREKNKNV